MVFHLSKEWYEKPMRSNEGSPKDCAVGCGCVSVGVLLFIVRHGLAARLQAKPKSAICIKAAVLKIEERYQMNTQVFNSLITGQEWFEWFIVL